jgi:hypothetical protein
MEALRMKKLTAMSLAVVLVTLIVPGLVHAQDLITVGGVLQTADCQANTLTLKTGDGSPRVFGTASTTAVYINSVAADLCTLPQYAGHDATVWLAAAGDHLVAGRVDISVLPAPVAAQGYSYGTYGYGPYGYGPYFDPYYNPYLNYNPYYYGTYLYPFDVDFGFGGRFNNRGFDRGRDRGFRGNDRGGFHAAGTHGGFSGARMTGGFGIRGGGHGGGRR